MSNAHGVRPPPLHGLAGFEASARLGSFTMAAEQLGLTQGAVSRQVAQLEVLLGQRLFQRSRHGLVLTPEGRAYLDDIRPLLSGIARATQRARAGAGKALSLSVPASLASYWLLPRLPDFLRAHPRVLLNLATRVGPVDPRAAGLDAAIMFGEAPPPGCEGCAIMSLVLLPVAASHTQDGLERLPLLHQTTLPDAWPRFLSEQGIRRQSPMEGPVLDLMAMGLAGAEAGMGAALLPGFMVDPPLAGGRLRRLCDAVLRPTARYWLCWPAGDPTSAVRSLASWLAAQGGASNP